jgi:hypothetical protein
MRRRKTPRGEKKCGASKKRAPASRCSRRGGTAQCQAPRNPGLHRLTPPAH